MKKLLLIIPILLFSSCTKEAVYNSSSDKDIYSITTPISFTDETQIKSFEEELAQINEKFTTSSAISREKELEYIIKKAELLDNLGNTGEAIKLLEDNYASNIDQNIKYNKLLALLYEKIDRGDLAIPIYEFFIDEKGDYYYLQNLARVYRDTGDDSNYSLLMGEFDKKFREENFPKDNYIFSNSNFTKLLKKVDIIIDSNFTILSIEDKQLVMTYRNKIGELLSGYEVMNTSTTEADFDENTYKENLKSDVEKLVGEIKKIIGKYND